MKKKKILFLNYHFQYSDGTVQALIGLVNTLDPEKFDITIKPIFRCDRRLEPLLREDIKLEKTFGFTFRGFPRLLSLLPKKWIYKFLVREDYDIEVGFQTDLPTYAIGSSQNTSAIHIAWMHGWEIWPDIYERCDFVVCVSKSNADKVKAELGDEVNVTYLYNLIDDAAIRTLAMEPAPLERASDMNFISVGRLSPEKGYARLITIFSDLHKEGFAFSLVIVGDGPLRSQHQKQIEQLGMGEHIKLVGADPNPHKYTVQSDVFICSSFSEGFSTVCTEAAILGIPIITTNVSGGDEIIELCECGTLTEIDDDSLKKGIRDVLTNPSVVEDWKRIMKNTSKNFGKAARQEKITNLFNRMYEEGTFEV